MINQTSVKYTIFVLRALNTYINRSEHVQISDKCDAKQRSWNEAKVHTKVPRKRSVASSRDHRGLRENQLIIYIYTSLSGRRWEYNQRERPLFTNDDDDDADAGGGNRPFSKSPPTLLSS